MLFALENNQRDPYNPAALEAIDLIIEIEKHSDEEPAQECARYILNDLHYFQLEVRSDDKRLYEEIENVIKEKLKPYADESFKVQT